MRRGGIFSIIILAIIFLVAGVVWKNNLAGVVAGVGRWNLCSFNADLKLENEKLKAQVWELTNNTPVPKTNILKGQIHSAYPFNNKNLLSISIGSNQGVEKGLPVTVDGSILIGQVSEVFKNYSLFKVVFSPDWDLPVRIGQRKVPALLVGGPTPKLMMISQDKKLEEGETVFSANQDFPYGLKMGEVTNIKSDQATGVFREAGLKLGYELNDLVEVIILPWQPD